MWKQRLILDINTDLITEKTPIFLHIPPLVEAKDSLGPAYLKTICSSLNCAKIGIEPRYFGESLPMGQDSYLTNNLKFLTI